MKLITNLRTELKQLADPAKAPKMQAYMKSTMPYHGVAAPEVSKLCRSFFSEELFKTSEAWQNACLSIWREAKYREERYCALHLAGHRLARPFQVPKTVKMYEEMVVTGAWWDFVDNIASHKIGPLVRSHPETMHKRMLTWSRSQDLWKRRTAILCQLSAKDKTDLKLLYLCIEPAMDSREFFLRKAIGWALREVSWRDPQEVIRYVKKHRDQLSGLTKREALKQVIKAGLIDKIP